MKTVQRKKTHGLLQLDASNAIKKEKKSRTRARLLTFSCFLFFYYQLIQIH